MVRSTAMHCYIRICRADCNVEPHTSDKSYEGCLRRRSIRWNSAIPAGCHGCSYWRLTSVNGTVAHSALKRHGAWIRYGDPVRSEQVDFAIANYQVAILQPWETDVARQLKDARPDMTVLCYKCLSSTRSYEHGPNYSSGLSYHEADMV